MSVSSAVAVEALSAPGSWRPAGRQREGQGAAKNKVLLPSWHFTFSDVRPREHHGFLTSPPALHSQTGEMFLFTISSESRNKNEVSLRLDATALPGWHEVDIDRVQGLKKGGGNCHLDLL